MSSSIKVLFVIDNDSVRRKKLRFWDRLASTAGWKMTGYGNWAVDIGSVPLPGLLVVVASEGLLGCQPDAAEMILRAHDFVRVNTILGHESNNTRYFKAPSEIDPVVHRSLLPKPTRNYPSMFKVILTGISTSEAMIRMRWKEFWYKFTETRIWQRTNFTEFSFNHNTVWVTTPDALQDKGRYTLAREILQENGFRTRSAQMAIIPEFYSPPEIPDVTKNDSITDPQPEFIKILFSDDTSLGLSPTRPKLRKFMSRLLASLKSSDRSGYNWHFSRDNEILLTAIGGGSSFSELTRLLRDHGFHFLGNREAAPTFQAPLEIPKFHAE